MEDVGYVSANPAVLEQFKATSTHTLREQNLLDAIQLAMAKGPVPAPSVDGYTNPAQLVIGLRSSKPLSDPSNRAIWKRDVRMSLYRNLESATTASTSGGANDNLKQFLSSMAKEPSALNEQFNIDTLTQEIGRRLGNFMLLAEEDVDVKQSLVALGVDSLVAIEIRNWWRQALGLEISVLEIMNSGSIEALGKIAAGALISKWEVKGGGDGDGDTYLLMKAP